MAYPISNKPVKPLDNERLDVSSCCQKSSWLKGLITLVVILAIIGCGIYFIANYTGLKTSFPLLGDSLIFKADWQAVFLTNGQVYFGKISKVDEGFLYLSDIYYLQVITLQNTIGQPPDVQTQPEQRLTLIKMGNELHGPSDEIIINRDHVIIIEDLKSDGRVVQAINDYLTGGQKEPNQPVQ